jgi:hypothetical protein
VFECGRAAHTALFEKSKRNVVDYTRRQVDKESVLLARTLETMTTPVNIVPAPPAQIKDHRNLGVMMND